MRRILGVLGVAFVLAMPAPAAFASVDAGTRGVLLALDADTGDVGWKVETPGYFAIEDVSPTRVIGRGFSCETTDFESIAYGATRGARRWRGPAGEDRAGSIGGNAQATGSTRTGVVVVESGDDRSGREVQGRAAASGRVRWRLPVRGDATAVVTSDSVFVTDRSGGTHPSNTFTALDRRTGDVRYRRSPDLGLSYGTGGARGAALSFIGPEDANHLETRVLDEVGHERWRVDEPFQSIAASVIALGTPPGTERAMVVRDLVTGEALWTRAGLGQALAAGPGRIAIVEERTFTMVDERTGVEIWSRRANGDRFPLVIGNEVVVMADGRHSIAVVDARTGTERWRAELPEIGDHVVSAGLGADTVFVTVGCTPTD